VATALPNLFRGDFRAVNLGGTVIGHLALKFESLERRRSKPSKMLLEQVVIKPKKIRTTNNDLAK
jgi:hypothetical protein